MCVYVEGEGGDEGGSICVHVARYTSCIRVNQTADLSFFCFTSLCSCSNLACFSKIFLRNGTSAVLQYNHADAAHFQTWRQHKSSLYLSSSSDSSRSSSNWESSAKSDGPSSDMICREDPRLFTDNVITLLGNSPRSAALGTLLSCDRTLLWKEKVSWTAFIVVW